MVSIAAITPRGSQGEIDAGAVFELIDYLCSALKGSSGSIVLFDAAGEYPALNPADRSRVLRLAVKRSRVPVMAGVGSATLDLSVDLARAASDAGAQALLLPPPYFLPCSQEDLREFYLHFSVQSVRCPVYLEHLPGFTTPISADTARNLLATGRFAGIVDSTGEHTSAGQQTVFANDRLFARARCSGSPVISAAACAAPELLLSLDSAIAANNAPEVERLNGRLNELLDWSNFFPPFTLFRAAAALRRIKTGPDAMPLSPEKQQRMQEFKEWFTSWK
ncbi:MAG TPA: dihydrodipicolinate synthase family protein [Bryobacteraceae bacterium]|nr:dihydrodipicolinate synthase family protein [Bryobacteraceae bacterium]